MTNNIYKAEVSGKIRAFESDARRYYKFGPTLNNNITFKGSPTVSGTIISNFSTNNYLTSHVDAQQPINQFKLDLKLKTGTSLTADGAVIYFSSNGAYYFTVCCFNRMDNAVALMFRKGSEETYSGFAALSDTEYVADTWYWVRWIYENNYLQSYYSLDGINYIPKWGKELDESETEYYAIKHFTSTDMRIGFGMNPTGTARDNNVFKGSLDLSQCNFIINNKLVWSGTYPEVSDETDYDYYKDIKEYKLLKI